MSGSALNFGVRSAKFEGKSEGGATGVICRVAGGWRRRVVRRVPSRASDLPSDRDTAGVWRLAAFTVAVGYGGVSLAQARTTPGLRPSQRVLAGLVGSCYMAGGLACLAKPPLLGETVAWHPTRTLGICFLPLAAAPATGGALTPLRALAAASAGSSAAIYGRRQGTQAASVAAGIWMLQARLAPSPSGAGRHWAWTYFAVPLAYRSAVLPAANLATIALNARAIDAKLAGLSRERETFASYGEGLRNALSLAEDALNRALTVHWDDLELRDLGIRSLGRLHEGADSLYLAGRVPELLRPSGVGAQFRALTSRLRALVSTTPSLASFVEDIAMPLRELATSRVHGFAIALDLAHVRVRNDISDEVELSGGLQLGVAGAAITAGISNALRHSRGLRHIAVRSAEPARSGENAFRIIIEDDGASDARPFPDGDLGLGLRALETQASRVGGEVCCGSLPGGGFRLELKLPGPATASDPELQTWGRIFAKLDEALLYAMRSCGIMAWIGLSATCSKTPRRLRSTITNAAPPLLHQLLVWRDEPRSRRAWPLLVGAAGATWMADGEQRGLLCAWMNVAMFRYAIHNPPPRTLLLLLPPVAGLAGAYRGEGERLLQLSSQVAITATGTLALVGLVLPKLSGLRQREAAITSALTSLEHLHRLAADFHYFHPSIRPIGELAAKSNDAATRAALQMGLAAIEEAGTRNPQHASVEALVHEIADVFKRRIWPVRLKSNPDRLSLRWGPGQEAYRMQFRMHVLQVADLIAREAISRSGVNWMGRPRVTDITIEVSAMPGSGNIRLAVSPVRAAGADERGGLGEQLQRFNAELVDWSVSGRLTVALFPSLYRPQLPAPASWVS